MAVHKLTYGIESKLKVKIAVLKKLEQENRLKKLKVNVGSKSRRQAEPSRADMPHFHRINTLSLSQCMARI